MMRLAAKPLWTLVHDDFMTFIGIPLKAKMNDNSRFAA